MLFEIWMYMFYNTQYNLEKFEYISFLIIFISEFLFYSFVFRVLCHRRFAPPVWIPVCRPLFHRTPHSRKASAQFCRIIGQSCTILATWSCGATSRILPSYLRSVPSFSSHWPTSASSPCCRTCRWRSCCWLPASLSVCSKRNNQEIKGL